MGNPPEKSALVIESNSSPNNALAIATMVANVHGKIAYTVQKMESRKWKIILTKGVIEDLRKMVEVAMGMNKGMRMVEGE